MKQVLLAGILFACCSSCMENHSDLVQKASYTVSNSFEPEQDWKNTALNVRDSAAVSGEYVAEVTPEKEFGPCYEKNYSEILPVPVRRIHAECMVFCKSAPEGIKLVLSVDGKEKNLFWLDRWVEKCGVEKGKWCLLKADWKPDTVFSKTDRVKIYFWNSKKGHFLTDNFTLTFYPY